MNFPEKILIVDDEAHVRTFLSKVASTHLGDPKIFEAPDATSALETVQREKPDLVLLDVNLVGMSGLAVLDQIRTFDEDVVVIMLSTVTVATAIQEAIDHGADGYVLKHTGSEKVVRSLVAAVEAAFE